MTIKKINIKFNDNDFGKYNHAFILKNKNSKHIFVIKSKTIKENPAGNILIIPPYAINSHELFLFNYYLLENNFNVYRFDGINNVGLSSGNIENYTLGQLEEDISLVIDSFFKKDNLPLIILTQSISFPVALKYSTYNDQISKIISILGVVDVKDTIERVSNTLLDPYIRKEPDLPKNLLIFGNSTIVQSFVDDMIINSLSTIEDTIFYFKRTKTPVFMVSSKNDEYVNYKDVTKCKEYIEEKGKLIVLSDISHMIGRSLFLAKKLAKLTVEIAANRHSNKNNFSFPKLTDVIKFASIEAEFLNKCISKERI